MLRTGDVLAYPPEAVFGLDCDPQDLAAIEQEVIGHFGDALDGLLAAPLGGAGQPCPIRDALTGAIIRP